MVNERTNIFIDKDNDKIKFPLSLEKSFENKIKWYRPVDFVRNFMIQKEIKTNFPNKQIYRMKEEVYDYYYSVELLLRKIDDYQKKKKFILKEDFMMENNQIDISNDSIKDKQNKSEINKNEPQYFNNDNLEEYKGYVLEYVDSEILNNFNDYNSYAFNKEIYSNKLNKNLEKYMVIFEGTDSFNIKRNIYKPFFKFYESQQTFKMVNSRERIQSEGIMKKRLQEEIKTDIPKDIKNIKLNSLKNSNEKNNKLKDISMEIDELREISYCNLSFPNDIKVPIFTKWITSIFQLILDSELLDVNTNRNFIYNIYPQKDNVPIISPSGRYWIKLYFMGKPRKIEIDDRMPSNISEDFLLPRCENFDEIWPSIISKALLKLNSYKYSHKAYKEISDLSNIYSLLGYPIEKIQMHSSRITHMEKFFAENDSIENSHFKIFNFACVNLSNEDLNIFSTSNNLPNQYSRRFNFSFRILDPDKDIMDTSIGRFSIRSKLTNQDSMIKPSKPKLTNILSKIFNSKKNVNIQKKPLFKSFGDIFIKKNSGSENFKKKDKIIGKYKFINILNVNFTIKI